MREEDVVAQLEKSEEGRKWMPWCRQCFRARELEIEWDGRVRGRGRTNVRAPQRITSLISAISYLNGTNNRQNGDCLGDKIPTKRAKLEISLYIDDLQSGIYIREPDIAKRFNMGEMLQEADVEVNKIAAENHLPLEEPKHEQLILRTKRRRKTADVKWGQG